MPPRVVRLRNAWAAGNIEEVRRAAHSLKGSAGNIGARKLHAICGKLDELGKSRALADGAALVAELDGEFDNVDREIRRIIAAT